MSGHFFPFYSKRKMGTNEGKKESSHVPEEDRWWLTFFSRMYGVLKQWEREGEEEGDALKFVGEEGKKCRAVGQSKVRFHFRGQTLVQLVFLALQRDRWVGDWPSSSLQGGKWEPTIQNWRQRPPSTNPPKPTFFPHLFQGLSRVFQHHPYHCYCRYDRLPPLRQPWISIDDR